LLHLLLLLKFAVGPSRFLQEAHKACNNQQTCAIAKVAAWCGGKQFLYMYAAGVLLVPSTGRKRC
jgi:hypothetical protein